MKAESHIEIIPGAASVPLLLRLVAVLIIVGGLLSILFFVLVGIFHLNDDSFIGNEDISGLGGNFYSFYIVLHIVLYSSFVLSGVYLMRLRKSGYYLFIINYLILTAFAIYLNDTFSWSTVIIGLSLLAVLSVYIKKMH